MSPDMPNGQCTCVKETKHQFWYRKACGKQGIPVRQAAICDGRCSEEEKGESNSIAANLFSRMKADQSECNDGSTAEYGALDTFCPPELAAWLESDRNNESKQKSSRSSNTGKPGNGALHRDDETQVVSLSTGLIDGMESKRGIDDDDEDNDEDEDAALESLLGKIGISSIEDNTPAGAALRANASVHVGKLGKVARSLHAQSLRKFVKRATLRAKSGNVRGKPPRIPPLRPTAHEATSSGVEIYVVEEEEDDVESKDEDSALLPTSPEPVPEKPPLHVETKVRIDVLDENASDIPPEVMAGTMETGRKGEKALRGGSNIRSISYLLIFDLVLVSVDPHSILQSQRWRRKRRKGKRSKRKSYVKGKVIDGQHELYTLSIAVMIGVRTSIAKTNALINSLKGHKKWLTTDDFVASEKYEFKPSVRPTQTDQCCNNRASDGHCV
jgi:hypothetical protein